MTIDHFASAESLLNSLENEHTIDKAAAIAAAAQVHATLAGIQQQAQAVEAVERQVAVQRQLVGLMTAPRGQSPDKVKAVDEPTTRLALTWVIAYDMHSAIAACVERNIEYGRAGRDAFDTRIRTTPRSLHGASPRKGDRVLYADPSESTLAEWRIACTSLAEGDLEVIE